MQGTWVRYFIWEDNTYLRATEPVYYHSGAHSLEPAPSHRRSHCNEKPAGSNEDLAQTKIKNKKRKYRRSWEARSWDLQSRDTGGSQHPQVQNHHSVHTQKGKGVDLLGVPINEIVSDAPLCIQSVCVFLHPF